MSSIYDSVIIGGGKGMLGHALADALRKRDVEPLIIDRDECDITDPKAVQQLFAEHRPTLLLNCAAHTAVDRLKMSNPSRTPLMGMDRVIWR